MKYENIRKQVLEAILDAVDQGLIKGTSGNIALRDDEDDVVAITPSGISYKHMTADQIAIVDLNGNGWTVLLNHHQRCPCIPQSCVQGRM